VKAEIKTITILYVVELMISKGLCLIKLNSIVANGCYKCRLTKTLQIGSLFHKNCAFSVLRIPKVRQNLVVRSE